MTKEQLIVEWCNKRGNSSLPMYCYKKGKNSVLNPIKEVLEAYACNSINIYESIRKIHDIVSDQDKEE